MKDHISSLTAIRGIAAILVVAFHATRGFLPHAELDQMSDFVAKGYLWVDLFFLLSGFIMMHVYGRKFADKVHWNTVKPFLFARLARLYPLHLCVLALFVGLEAVKWAAVHWGVVSLHAAPFSGPKNPDAIAVNLLMLQTTGIEDQLTWNFPAWSIGAEWYAYLAFPALVGLLVKGDRVTRAGLVLIAGAVLWLVSHGGTDLDVTYDYGVVRCLCEFVVGALAYRFYRSRRGAGWLDRDVVLAVVAAAIVVVMHFGIADVLVVPLFGVLLLGLAFNDQREGLVGRLLARRPFQFLGDISYAVYMSHVLILETLEFLCRVTLDRGFGHGLSLAQSVAAMVPLLAVVILFSTALHRWVELPARDALKASRFATSFIYANARA